VTFETGIPKSEKRNSKLETGSSVVVEEQPTIDNRQTATAVETGSSVVVEEQSAIVNRQSSITLPLLLEVGCEEIPARFLRDAEKGLGERVLAAVSEARLLPGASLHLMSEEPGIHQSPIANHQSPIQTYSTPRRLVVHVPTVLAQQPDKVEEILGPPLRVAIDAEGKYTRAAESFAQKNSAQVEDLARTTTPKGEYLSLRKTTQGRPALEILPEILPGAILGLTFPKSMYWTEKLAPRFVRPIRWMLAILGEGKRAQTVDFEILGVKAGDCTFGHRLKGRKPLRVTGFNNYMNKLSKSHVIVDHAVRLGRVHLDCKRLLDELQSKALGNQDLQDKDFRLSVVKDEGLEEWVANSTEWPTAIFGTFDMLYQALPREILVTVMRDHQKYFAIENEHGVLQSRFIAFLNRDGDPEGLIKQGHERVLRARFADALFFWNADQRTLLRDRVPLLDKVTYQAKLGSYGDKIRRMKVIAGEICGTLETDGALKAGQGQQVLRAVELCKCDLTTQMVQEFTELQGIVGGLYAKAQGEAEEVSTAIYDHYLPPGAEGASPRTLVGALVSLADKVDSVVGGFVAGLEPTGSRDPFALRRAGNGIIKVLVEFSLPIGITNLAMSSLETHGRDWRAGEDLGRIANFLEERLRFYLETVGECRHDTVWAVMAVGRGFPVEALNRARALEKIRDSEDYVALAAAAKRTRNILRKSASGMEYLRGTLNADLFQEEAEVELHKAYASIFETATGEGIIARDYETILTLTARLRPAIDKFFDQVLVMHEDPAIRKNRLLLLALLDKQVFSRVADLSEIEGHVDASTSAR
jgi:glycyl-tRNA synthetase beta chain